MIEEIIIFGAVQGAVYALLALGYSLVYGVGGILNLAHGSYYLLSMYAFYLTWLAFGGLASNLPSYVVGILISLIIATAAGMLSYLFIVKPLEDSPISMLIGTFAIGFFAEQLISVMYDPKFHSIPIPDIFNRYVTVLGVNLQIHWFIILGAAIIIVILITLFINKTRIGKSIRAVSQDREAAMLMGINADRMLMYTIMISAFLAGIAAVLFVPVDVVAPYKGWPILTNAIAVVVLGGMGSLPGSVVGGFIIGYARIATNYLIDPVYSSLIPVIIIIVILVIRPQGIFGKKEID